MSALDDFNAVSQIGWRPIHRLMEIVVFFFC